MIAYDFDYYLPDTVQEAVQIYDKLSRQGKQPLYYGGGTEIISMSRVFNRKPDAVIDFKSIPECRGIGTDGKRLVIGAASTLNDIKRANVFPLLGLAAGRIADHTVQCRLTLGGNLCGTIIYRETLMPLLLANATVDIAFPEGMKTISVHEAFADGRRPASGELIVSVHVDSAAAAIPCFHIKKSRAEKIGYPLLTLCVLFLGETLRFAAGGLCAHPFRFADITDTRQASAADIAARLLSAIPAPVLDDLEGSAAYRLFVFQRTVEKIIMDYKKNREASHA